MAETKEQRMAVEERSSSVLRTMFIFSMGMLTVPIFSYFFSKSMIFEAYFEMSSTNSYFYAAIVAIVAVHVILALFIYVAWKEGSRPYPPTFKVD